MKKKDATIATVAVLAASALIAGLWVWSIANGPRAVARETVRSMLKDPESARFQTVTLYPATGIVCGRFTAKTGLGTYGPPRHFVAQGENGVWLEMDAGDVANTQARLAELPRLMADCPDF